MSGERLCGCGCGQTIPSERRATVRYIDHAHANRAYRARLHAELEAAGLPTNLSLETARLPTGTARRPGDGPSSSRKRERRAQGPIRSDLKLSWGKTVSTVAGYLTFTQGLDKAEAADSAVAILAPALPARHRLLVEEQGA